jgi:hypothetical protein
MGFVDPLTALNDKRMNAKPIGSVALPSGPIMDTAGDVYGATLGGGTSGVCSYDQGCTTVF